MPRWPGNDTTPSSEAVDVVPVMADAPAQETSAPKVTAPTVSPKKPPKAVPMPKVQEHTFTVQGPSWAATLVFATEPQMRSAIAAIANKTGRGQECSFTDLNGRHWFTKNFHIFVPVA